MYALSPVHMLKLFKKTFKNDLPLRLDWCYGGLHVCKVLKQYVDGL